jgi:hypothetical protein
VPPVAAPIGRSTCRRPASTGGAIAQRGKSSSVPLLVLPRATVTRLAWPCRMPPMVPEDAHGRGPRLAPRRTARTRENLNDGVHRARGILLVAWSVFLQETTCRHYIAGSLGSCVVVLRYSVMRAVSTKSKRDRGKIFCEGRLAKTSATAATTCGLEKIFFRAHAARPQCFTTVRKCYSRTRFSGRQELANRRSRVSLRKRQRICRRSVVSGPAQTNLLGDDPRAAVGQTPNV